MGVHWKSKQTQRNLLGKSTLTHQANMLSPSIQCIGDEEVLIPTKILDLSFPTTTTDVWATNFWRKSFYANERFWVFYSDGTNMVYRTSADAITWSSPTTIRACEAGNLFSVWFDGTYIHYAATPLNGYNQPIVYRKGIPNADGTITWSTTEQTVLQHADMAFRFVNIAVDSAGYPWIGMEVAQAAPLPAGTFADVTKSSTKDGTWTTQSGFPYRPDATANKRDTMHLVPLTSQKMYIIYVWSGAPLINPVNGRLWDGSAWGAEETVTTRNCNSPYERMSAIAYGEVIHLVYEELPPEGGGFYGDVYHCKRVAGVWSETLLASRVSKWIGWYCLSLTVQQETGYIWVFYIYSNVNPIYYRRYKTEWEVENLLQDRAPSTFTINSYYQVYGDKIGVIWMESPSPYTIAHSGLYI